MLAAIHGLADILPKAAILIGKKLIEQKACVSRIDGSPASNPEKLPLAEAEPCPVDVAQDKKNRRERFAEELEEKERAEGRRDNPSLDPATQRAIELDYRALHEQIKAENLYQCRYSEYATECVRYAFLFACFASLLYCKWYLTSAIFLGLFWVGSSICPSSSQPVANLFSSATNHVHST